ncbi:hypothetical protein QE410_000138 [Microbacterium sp. SORGH_AS 1204]|nr:hypothetical protein [Microbacterium sp. SORGH_AS_1204]
MREMFPCDVMRRSACEAGPRAWAGPCTTAERVGDAPVGGCQWSACREELLRLCTPAGAGVGRVQREVGGRGGRCVGRAAGAGGHNGRIHRRHAGGRMPVVGVSGRTSAVVHTGGRGGCRLSACQGTFPPLCTAPHRTARSGTARPGAGPHRTARPGTAPHRPARHRTARPGTAPHGTAPRGSDPRHPSHRFQDAGPAVPAAYSSSGTSFLRHASMTGCTMRQHCSAASPRTASIASPSRMPESTSP